jgi:membrane-bound lytic murein transglycosylase C
VLPVRARSFAASVSRHGGGRGLDPALVFAIMETESAFNPLARSHVPAYGLMQIVPRSAGLDATAELFGRARLLSPSYLYDPDRNVQIGAIYLDILWNRYLAGVRSPKSRLYCVIAAYNTGAGNVFRAFTGRTRSKAAFEAINAMQPDDVYRKLIWDLPYKETRDYLAKVVRRMDTYRR